MRVQINEKEALDIIEKLKSPCFKPTSINAYSDGSIRLELTKDDKIGQLQIVHIDSSIYSTDISIFNIDGNTTYTYTSSLIKKKFFGIRYGIDIKQMSENAVWQQLTKLRYQKGHEATVEQQKQAVKAIKNFLSIV